MRQRPDALAPLRSKEPMHFSRVANLLKKAGQVEVSWRLRIRAGVRITSTGNSEPSARPGCPHRCGELPRVVGGYFAQIRVGCCSTGNPSEDPLIYDLLHKTTVC